jgi:hypothetical protein
MTTAPTAAPAVSAMEVYDSLFLFNFMSSFPQNQCGSPNSLDIGFLSMACILPLFVWIGMFVILLYSREAYFVLTQFTMWALTLIQVPMLLCFDRSPPVAGCGPSHAWPCPQVSLVACGLSQLMCYSYGHKRQGVLRQAMAMAAMAYVVHAVLYIGFADATGVLAGVLVGCMVGCLQHELLTILEESHPLAVRMLNLLDFVSQHKTVNHMLKIPAQVTSMLADITAPVEQDVPDPMALPQKVDVPRMRHGLSVTEDEQ